MTTLDRFDYGFRDRQAEDPDELCECCHDRCRNPIYYGEANWEYYGEWYCSALCLARQLGAEKRYVS